MIKSDEFLFKRELFTAVLCGSLKNYRILRDRNIEYWSGHFGKSVPKFRAETRRLHWYWGPPYWKIVVKILNKIKGRSLRRQDIWHRTSPAWKLRNMVLTVICVFHLLTAILISTICVYYYYYRIIFLGSQVNTTIQYNTIQYTHKYLFTQIAALIGIVTINMRWKSENSRPDDTKTSRGHG